MKRSIGIALVVFLFLQANAQDHEYRTIFDAQDLRITGMGGPFMQFTTLGGEFAHMMGGGGAVLLNNFFVGGYGLGLTNMIPDYVNQNTDHTLTLGHGGFWMGYALAGNRPVHASLSTLVGWGEFGIMEFDRYYPFVRDQVFVLTPMLEVELNLTRYFRLGIGATYNLVTMVDEGLHGYRSADLSSPGAVLSFKFGWF
ncbi:MAG: hypothetical protein R2751_03130 [Bacteroidales bacterium]